jgi:hypothetical protein
MDKQKRIEFCKTIAALAATFRQEATEALYEGYWLGLDDVPVEAVKSAVVQAMRSCRFMPSVAELRALAGVLSPDDRAVKAWAAVMQAHREHGYYHTVVFDDPATTATVRYLWHDWMQFAEAMEQQEEHWLRKEFVATYCSFVRNGVGLEQCRPLLGFFERENTLGSWPVEPPLMIACGLSPVPGQLPAAKEAPKQIAGVVGTHIGQMPEGEE